MSTYYDNLGNKIKVGTKPIGVGGEANIYNIVGKPKECAKIYNNPTLKHYQKLSYMVKNPPTDPMLSKRHRSIAWPSRLLFKDENKRKFAGFVMPKISSKSFDSLIQYSDPDNRDNKFHGKFTWYHSLNTARNIASAVAAIHDRGYVIGDIKDMNILVSQSTLTTIIDCDSFQVVDSSTGKVFRSPVGTGEYTPPEFLGKQFKDVNRTIEADSFGLAVLIFKLLMECFHPFSGKWLLPGAPPQHVEEKIKKGLFPYGRKLKEIGPAPKAPPFNMLHPELQQLFFICFVEGHLNPNKRPTAHEWWKALRELKDDIVRCSQNNNHFYFDHLKSCPWCEREINLGIYSFSSPVGFQSRLRKKPGPKAATKLRSPPKIPSYITYGAEDIIIMSEKIAILVGIVFGALLSLLPIKLSEDWATYAYGCLFLSSLGFGLTNMYRAKYWPDTNESIKKGAVAGFSIAVIIFLLGLIAYKYFREETSRAVLGTLIFFPFLYITTLASEILRGSLEKSLSKQTRRTTMYPLLAKPLIPLAFIIVIVSFLAIPEFTLGSITRIIPETTEPLKVKVPTTESKVIQQTQPSKPYTHGLSIGTLSGRHNKQFLENNSFEDGDLVGIKVKARNISHNGKINLSFKFIIYDNDTNVVQKHVESYNSARKETGNVNCYGNECFASYKFSIGSNWEADRYDAYVYMTDNIINENIFDSVGFYVTKKAKAVEDGFLRVYSNPSKVLIWVRSKYSSKIDTKTCKTPCKIKLHAGDYVIEASELGYEDLRIEAAVKAYKTTEVDLRLKKMRTVGGN